MVVESNMVEVKSESRQSRNTKRRHDVWIENVFGSARRMTRFNTVHKNLEPQPKLEPHARIVHVKKVMTQHYEDQHTDRQGLRKMCLR